MTNADLRKLALAATPGEWEVGSYGPHDKHVRTCDEYAHLKKDGTEKKIPRPDKLVVATTCDALFSTRPPSSRAEADSAFIAAANPTRVLALLDALAAKDAETERLRAVIRAAEPIAGRMRRMLDDDLCSCDGEYPHVCGRDKATEDLAKYRALHTAATPALSPPAPASAGEPGKRCSQ